MRNAVFILYSVTMCSPIYTAFDLACGNSIYTLRQSLNSDASVQRTEAVQVEVNAAFHAVDRILARV